MSRATTTRWLIALDEQLALRGLNDRVNVYLPSSRLCTIYVGTRDYRDVSMRVNAALVAIDELRPERMTVRVRRAVNGGVDVKVDSRYL
jgi:hypothetical protein